MKVRADSNGDGRGDEAMSIELVMALKLYTDHDAMQWALKQCLRGAADYDLSRLFEWRELLDFAVSRCGAKMRRHRLFHGVRDAMELDAERYTVTELVESGFNLSVLFNTKNP